MMSFRRPSAPLGRLVAAALLVIGTTAAARHITPTVELRKQADVIRQSLPGAQHYFVRRVTIGRQDLERIRAEVSFKPEDPEYKFFLGRDDGDRVIGVVLFPQSNTQHGPLEVGLTMTPDGRIARVVATKATVETKPWVLRAVRSGFLDAFVGMRHGDDPAKALEGLSRDDLGAMPYYFAQVTVDAVKRGLAVYDALYAGSTAGSH